MASVARTVGQGLAVATVASSIVVASAGGPASAGPYTACYQQSQNPVDGYTTEDFVNNTQCTTNPDRTFVYLRGANVQPGGTLRVKAKIVGSVKGIKFARATLMRGNKVIRLRLRISPGGFVSFARKPKPRGYWALTITYGASTITTNFRVS